MDSRIPVINRYVQGTSPDIVIAGAGMSGLQFAKDVSRKASVLVLEAGQNLGTNHIYWDMDSATAQDRWQTPTNDPSFVRPWISTSDPHYASSSGIRQRLGGRSLYWHGVILPMDLWALSPNWWPPAVLSDLPSLYREQEQECTSFSSTEVMPPLVSFLHESGLSSACPAPLAVQHRQALDGTDRWAAYTPLTYWRTDSSMPPIVCNTKVSSLLVHSGRISGVRVIDTLTRDHVDISCSTVVLASGTIENSRIAAEVLYQLGHITAPILTGLSDHLVSGCMLRVQIDDMLLPDLVSGVTATAMISGTDTERSNYFIAITCHRTNGNLVDIDVWGMGEQLPQQDNVVRVDLDTQRTYVTASYSEADTDMLVQQQGQVARIVTTILEALKCPARLLPPLGLEHVGTVSEAYATAAHAPDSPLSPVWYVSSLGSVDHEGCTIPFGKVLSESGEFLGIRGLYAVGPCTFPRIGAANPSLTTLALAKRTAQGLR